MLWLFISIFLFVAIAFVLMNTAIKDKKFVCNKYILNTYLYVILSFIIIAIHVISLEKLKVVFNPGYGLFLLMFLGLIGLIFLIHFLSADRIILKHLIWLTFMILLATMFYLYTVYIQEKRPALVPNTVLMPALLIAFLLHI